MTFFHQIVDPHIETEGGWVHHPNDPGGETYKGMARRFNPDWEGWALIDAAKGDPAFPANLASNHVLHEMVRKAYHERYWQPMNLDLVEKFVVVRELFDQGAGPQGPVTAIKIVQLALIILDRNVTLDGVMGPQTAGAINSYSHIGALVQLQNNLQFVHFLLGTKNMDEVVKMVRERLPMLRAFMRGWLKRVR